MTLFAPLAVWAQQARIVADLQARLDRRCVSKEWTLHHGDCRDVLRGLASDSLDSCVTDSPYALVSIVKRFGSPGAAPAKGNEAYMRASAGFMGKTWDTGETAFSVEFWAEVYRVLKPGAFVVAFGASRGYHRMACAIEDAGFEIRDSLMWVYGTGFPKSHDVSKGIDKLDAVDVRRKRNLRFTAWMRSTGITSAQIGEVTGTNMGGHYLTDKEQPAIATRDLFEMMRPLLGDVPAWVENLVDERTVESKNWKSREITGTVEEWTDRSNYALTSADGFRRDKAFSPEALEWEGWGTALKPAFEPIVLARKPLSEGTVAANVLRWGTGALNIDATRIHTEGSEAKAYTVKRLKPGATLNTSGGNWRPEGEDAVEYQGVTKAGRWPANVVHDGSDEVIAAFPAQAGGGFGKRGAGGQNGIFSPIGGTMQTVGFGDSGSAARFFYSAKASRADRAGSKHPTVKPIALMAWLCRLVTPPGGTVLDPFAGSGTTGAAALDEGFRAVLVEREAEYVRDIKIRLAGDDFRADGDDFR